MTRFAGALSPISSGKATWLCRAPRSFPTTIRACYSPRRGCRQFAPYFVGAAAPPASRLVTVQRCVRTDDIEDVGDDTHHTFFEMLGHFSFGDYFKREAIAFAFEFVTKELGLPADRLWATIFAGEPGIPRDDEAEAAWQAVGIPASRIRSFGFDENWWDLETGPCGPDSEVFLDLGPEAGCGLPVDQCGPNHCNRFLEFWNAVFNQYNKAADGSLTPLERTGIDTGAGFERIVALLQDKPSAYETDLFVPLIAAAAAQTGVAYGEAVPAARRARWWEGWRASGTAAGYGPLAPYYCRAPPRRNLPGG